MIGCNFIFQSASLGPWWWNLIGGQEGDLPISILLELKVRSKIPVSLASVLEVEDGPWTDARTEV